jgi:hypothetical protein
MTKHFLYGHYYSRGGAQLIEAANREQADEAYVAIFARGGEWEAVEWQKELLVEDFISEPKLESYRPIEDG